MQVSSLSSLLRAEPLPPIVFLFGEEDFLLEEAFHGIISAYTKKSISDFDIDIVDGEDVSADRIVSMASAFPMMGEHRLVVVKHFEKAVGGRRGKQAEKSPLGTFLSSPPSHSTLVITLTHDSTAAENLKGMSSLSSGGRQADKAKAKHSKLAFPYKQLIDHASWIEFPALPEQAITQWIQKRVSARGKEIVPEAADFIQSRCGSSLREISQEIDKLLLFTANASRVTVDDALALVGESREYNVFELQKAVAERRREKALVILEKMLKTDRQEMQIIAMLTRYFLQLWKLGEASQTHRGSADMAKATGIMPYFIPEYMAVLQRYNTTQIEEAFFALREADTRLKTSSDAPVDVISDTLMRIMA